MDAVDDPNHLPPPPLDVPAPPPISPAKAALQVVLIEGLIAVEEVVESFRALRFIPLAPLQKKLPYYNEAIAQPSRAVLLPARLRAVRESLARHPRVDLTRQQLAARRRPVYHGYSPGLGTVLMANLALLWVLTHTQV